MVELDDGVRTKKLLEDPEVWYPVNAAIDGLEPWSASPVERLKYMVYQRRMMLEALKTQAMCVAYVNPEGAQKAVQAYLDVAMPVDPAAIEEMARMKEQQIQDVQNMKPFTMSQVSFGPPVGGDDEDVAAPPMRTSMHRPPKDLQPKRT